MITFDEASRIFYVENEKMSFALWIDPDDRVQQLYFGAPVAHDLQGEPVPHTGSTHPVRLVQADGSFVNPSVQSYAVHTLWGGDFQEPTLNMVFADGGRRWDGVYAGHRILREKTKPEGMPCCRGGEALEIDLCAKGVTVTLCFSCFSDTATVQSFLRVRNDGKTPVRLERAFGFALHLPGGDWEALTLPGYSRHERMAERFALAHGSFSVDSRRGLSSAMVNPFLALLGEGTTERHGEVYAVNLIYSGSFRLIAEKMMNETVRVTGGIQDCDFSWKLEPGETFTTPETILCYSDGGLEKMSHELHGLYRKHILPPQFAEAPRPIVCNNWEGTRFECTEERIYPIVDAAAGKGIDTFVLDDGWFGKRDDATSGLGDWTVNDRKIDLGKLIDRVHEKGMRFGLWFEPEMISEDSDLFRAHPDWAMQTPCEKPLTGRGQLVLDLTRKEVRDYVVEAVNRVIDSYDIDYVKWDCNRDLSEGYSLALEPERQQETAHRFVLGLYDLFERIVAAHPKILFEGCASGGNRFDGGVLYYFPQIWASDNADVWGRERIQYGTSLCYPLSSVSCHVARSPNRNGSHFVPWHTRAALAQFGTFGYELDLSRADAGDLAGIPAETAEYRKTEAMMLSGRVYRLRSPFGSNYFAMQTVSEDQSAAKLLVIREIYSVLVPDGRIYPRGLASEKRYFVPELRLTRTGASWMRFGLIPQLAEADFESAVYHFEEQK